MRKGFFQTILLITLFLNQISQTANSQESAPKIFEVTKENFEPDTPVFALRMFNFASDSLKLSKLYIQLNFPFNNLQFIRNRKTDDNLKKFRADFQTTLTISDSSGKEVEFKKWKGEIYAQNYQETKLDEKYGFTRNSVDLKPGEYNFKIELKDLETQRLCEMEGTVRLADFFTQKFKVSDLLFVNSIDFLEGVEPKKDDGGLYVYYEIYNIPKGDSASLSYKVELLNSQVQQWQAEPFQSKGLINRKYIIISKETLSSNFDVKVTVHYNGDSLSVLQQFAPKSQQRSPVYENIEESIEQLLYIADKKEIKRMKKLVGDEQINAFNEFWKKKDPTPETSVNEYLNLYYGRIAIANDKFKGLTPGWKTQMGMVFIKLGHPSYVDKPLGDSFLDPVYGRRQRVIWLYSMMNRRVIFELFGSDYRISNYHEIFDLLSDDDIRF